LPPVKDFVYYNEDQKTGQVPLPVPKRPVPFISSGYYTGILVGQRRIKFFLLYLLIAFSVSLKPAYRLISIGYPLITDFEEKVKSIIRTVYPAELTITIKNGYVSTNVPEPYYVNISKDFVDIFVSEEKEKPGSHSKVRLLAIDTRGKAEDFEKYQALALLTRSSLVYYGDEKINIKSLRNIQDLNINQDYLFSKFDEYNQDNRIESFLKIGLVLVIFIIVGGTFLIYLANIFFTSLLVWILVKINCLTFGFGRIYSFSAAVSFLPVLFFSLVSFFTPFNFILQFETFSTMIILALAYTLLIQLKDRLNHVVVD